MTDTATHSNVRPLHSKRGDEFTEGAVKPIAGLLAAYERLTVEQQQRAGQYFLGYVYDADVAWAAQVIHHLAAGTEGELRRAARVELDSVD